MGPSPRIVDVDPNGANWMVSELYPAWLNPDTFTTHQGPTSARRVSAKPTMLNAATTLLDIRLPPRGKY